MRAALYHRVSTVDQDAKLARGELRAAAKARGARVVLDVEEKGSGASNDRPEMQRVLEAARRHQIDVVIVWKLDRWGRSILDVLSNVRTLVEDNGVRFVCSSQGLDIRSGGDAVSKMMLTMLAAVAEFERDLISDRTKLGLARARQRGAKIGRPRVARPDVEAVRGVMLKRADAYPKPPLENVAKHFGCSVHALREVISGIRCVEDRYSFSPSYGKCDRPGRRCASCGANVCRVHWSAHECAPATRRKKGRVSARRAAGRARAPGVGKGGAN